MPIFTSTACPYDLDLIDANSWALRELFGQEKKTHVITQNNTPLWKNNGTATSHDDCTAAVGNEALCSITETDMNMNF